MSVARSILLALVCALALAFSVAEARPKGHIGPFKPVIHMERKCKADHECAAKPFDPPRFKRKCKFLKCAANNKCEYECKLGFPSSVGCRTDDDCFDKSTSGPCKKFVCKTKKKGFFFKKIGKCVEVDAEDCCVKDSDCEQPDDPLCFASCIGDVTGKQCAVACEADFPNGQCKKKEDCTEDDIPAPDRCGIIISELDCIDGTCKVTAALGPGAVFQPCKTDEECEAALGPPLEFGFFKCNDGACDQEFNCPVS